jgi:lysophospholipase L1-like esterase
MSTRAVAAAVGLGLFAALGLAYSVRGGAQSVAGPREAARRTPETAGSASAPGSVKVAASIAPPGGAVHTPELLRLRAEAQARMLGRGAEIEDAAGRPVAPPPQDAGSPDGNRVGVFTPVENEAALSAFHDALRKLERRELAGGKLRILAYGGSHTQADIYTGYLRHYLQSRFGNGGPGFVQMALERYGDSSGIEATSSKFMLQHVQNIRPRAVGWYGLLGAAAVATTKAAHASIRQRVKGNASTAASTLEVFTMGHPGGGEISLSIDGKKQATWSTRSAAPRPMAYSTLASADFSDITLRPVGNGSVRLFGAALERATPGIVIDTLGISGTRVANWLLWDEATWAEQVSRRKPSLVTLAYGTNETSDDEQPIDRYERDLDRVLERLRRAAPQASCLLIGPGDVGRKVDGRWIQRPRLASIIAAQRRQAIAHGCGFWDTEKFMGPGGIERWVAASPAMARHDRIHFTRRGYVKLGLALGDALLRAYDAERLGTSAGAASNAAAAAR